MTREEAIQVLTEISATLKSWSGFTKYPQAIDMAIEALSADTVSFETQVESTRQVLDDFAKDRVKVVRCKDCRYWKNFNNAQGICHERPNIITTEQYNDFCSHGERREP